MDSDTEDFPTRIDPQMREALKIQSELLPDWPESPTLDTIPRMRALYEKERRYWNQNPPQLPKVVDRVLPGPARDIPLRFYYPQVDRPQPAIVYVHGGGWILGNLNTHDRIMRLLAVNCGLPVVGIDYGLSPEHKFPSAIDEVRFLANHIAAEGATYDLDPRRLAFAGDSAGASISLAASLVPLEGKTTAIAGAALYYGAFGLKDTPSRQQFGALDPSMNEANLAFYRDCLLRAPADAADPRYDMLSADLSGIPPVFVAAAELDPIYDDSARLADRLENLGKTCDFRTYKGVLHGFLHLSLKVDRAQQALEDGSAWLRQILLA